MNSGVLSKIKGFWQSYVNNRDGVAAVEFALTALPYLMIFLGVMEMGRVMWTINSVQYAVEETSRYATLNSEDSDALVQAYMQDILEGLMVPTGGLSVATQTFTNNGVDLVEVNTTYEVTTLVDLFVPGSTGIYTFESTVLKPIVE